MDKTVLKLNVFPSGPRYVPLVRDCRRHVEVIAADDHVVPLDDILDDVMALAIDHYNGNVAAVAEYLGLARATVYNYIKRNRRRDALRRAYPK